MLVSVLEAMNSTMATTLMEVCRTCMGENELYFNTTSSRRRRKTTDLISIFTESSKIVDSEGLTIMDLLHLTVPQLTVTADDMLPKKLCASCIDNLNQFNSFQQMCMRVEERLQKIMKGNTEAELNIIDPLNSNTLDQLNSNTLDQTFNDLNNVLKIEMDDTVVDDNANAIQINETMMIVEVRKTTDVNCEAGITDGTDSSDGNDRDDADYDWEHDIEDTARELARPEKTVEPLVEVDKKNNDSNDITQKGDKPFACDECGSRLKTRKSLKRHKRIHLRQSGEEDHKCQHCNRVFQKLSSLKNHLKSHKDIYCNAGTHDYSDSSDEDDDEQEDANCEWEPRLDKDAVDLKLTNKTGIISAESTEAKEKFRNSPETEAEHKEDVDNQFSCDECGSRLKTRKSLKRHKRIHLRQPGEKIQTKTKYECEHCQKVFQQSSSLKDHLRIHTGEQPYLCSECGKAFKSLSNMKQHFLRHGTDRPYECPDCPKKFPCLSDLASHKAVHSKAKSHVCDICGAGFVKPYLLKKHKMYHTGEKNHKCDYCEMRFVLADQCRRHMRTHTGEKPYKCKYCVRAFAQSNDLIKHLRGHLGDNVYKCDMCPQGFRLQGDLRAHFNTHKNDDDETILRNLQALKDDEIRIQMKFGLVHAE